jgi:hypothetical protein
MWLWWLPALVLMSWALPRQHVNVNFSWTANILPGWAEREPQRTLAWSDEAAVSKLWQGAPWKKKPTYRWGERTRSTCPNEKQLAGSDGIPFASSFRGSRDALPPSESNHICLILTLFESHSPLLQMDQWIHLHDSVQTFAAKDLVHCSVSQL